MRVLVVGSGGREHALAWALDRSPSVAEVHAAPGNPGIGRAATCHPIAPDDPEAVLGLARSLRADLVVVGPEAPLVAGISDTLRHGGIRVFGPGAAAARIEGSKSFAKDVMEAAGVPTARRLAEPVAPCVVKADGLAAGKGVVVCRTPRELEDGLRTVRSFGGVVVCEELLDGPEVSLFAICDGRRAIPMAPAQDFKRAFDGDDGPNTGGMGSYAPVPGLGPDEVAELVELVHVPVLRELERRGSPFVGLLFAGLMLTPDGPRVLEFNCRFGDPETQSVLPIVEGDLAAALAAASAGDLEGIELAVRPESAAVTVVLTATGYPATGDTGSEIVGLEDAEAAGALVFHAGTAHRDGALVTNGGRVLNVTGLGPTVAAARTAAYTAADRIRSDALRRREDIALSAAAGAPIAAPA